MKDQITGSQVFMIFTRIIHYIMLFVISLATNLSLAYAGQNPMDKAETFNNYHEENYEELVYIQTDKNHYLTGEQIRFKVFCLEKSSSRPSQLSKVAYVEVLDKDNSPQIKARIELTNGTGYGEVFIPTNINSGNFILRGYSRWMRNYGPESFFHTGIAIINPFKRLGLKPIPADTAISIQFSPENNVLIDGLKTNVVFDLQDSNGNPSTFPGKLIANDSILVSEFTPSALGTGSFELVPDIQQNYHVELQHSDGSITKHPFIPIEKEGLSFQVIDKNSTYSLQIFCNDPAICEESDELYYIIHHKGQLIARKNLRLNKGAVVAQIESSLIKAGISSITLFSPDGKFLKQRQIYCLPKNMTEIFSVNKSTFEQREKATIELSASLLDPGAELKDITISVSTNHKNIGVPQLGLDEYLLIGNSLNAQVFRTGNIFEGPADQVSATINDMLIAYSKVDTLWLQGKGKDHVFIPEYRTPLITGKITNTLTKEPAPGVVTYISVVGKHVQFNSTSSKSDGTLIFEMKDFYGLNEIVVQTDYTKDTIYSIEIDDPFSTEYAKINVPVFNIDEELETWIKNQSQYMQVRNAYSRYKQKLPYLNNIDTSAFYGEPDAKYYLDDFTRFIVMEEVMREYVTGVNVRKNKDGFHFMVIDTDRNVIFEENPLMLLDGIPIFDADEIIALDPLKLEKIETIKKRFHKGYLDCRGIVSYTTYNGDLNGHQLNDHALVMEYQGVQKIRKYMSPSYATAYERRNTTPDFRDVLLWSPGSELDGTDINNLEFYTSDEANTYQIVINILTENGEVFSDKKIFQVRPLKNN